MNLRELNILPKLDISETCKGIKFRGYASTFWSGYKLESRCGVRFLKKDSCAGCSKCAHFDEFMEETPENIIGLNEVEHGKLYTLRVTNISRDWESGIVDEWDLQLVELNQ